MNRGFSKLDPQSHNGKTNVWLTPLWVLKPLGSFDTDPAAHKNWKIANTQYYENGLEKEWYGRVWLNPPYGKETGQWLKKLESHGDGIALVFARTDTIWFQSLKFDAINFMKGRVAFLRPDLTADTNAGSPSMLIAFGQRNVECLKSITGKIMVIRSPL